MASSFCRLKRSTEALRGMCTRRVITSSSEEERRPPSKRTRVNAPLLHTTTRISITRPSISMTRKTSVSMSENIPRDHISQKNITTSGNGDNVHKYQTVVSNADKDEVSATERAHSTQSCAQEAMQPMFKEPRACNASASTSVKNTSTRITRFSAATKPTTSRQPRVGIVHRRILRRDDEGQKQITSRNCENHSSRRDDEAQKLITSRNCENHSSSNNLKIGSNITYRNNDSTVRKHKSNSAANKHKLNTTSNKPNVDGAVNNQKIKDVFNDPKDGIANNHDSNSIVNDLENKGADNNLKHNVAVNEHNYKTAHIQQKCRESRNQPVFPIRKHPPKNQRKRRPSAHSGPDPDVQTSPHARPHQISNPEPKDQPPNPPRVIKKITASKYVMRTTDPYERAHLRIEHAIFDGEIVIMNMLL